MKVKKCTLQELTLKIDLISQTIHSFPNCSLTRPPDSQTPLPFKDLLMSPKWGGVQFEGRLSSNPLSKGILSRLPSWHFCTTKCSHRREMTACIEIIIYNVAFDLSRFILSRASPSPRGSWWDFFKGGKGKVRSRKFLVKPCDRAPWSYNLEVLMSCGHTIQS